MGIDAVALLRPRKRRVLVDFLDPAAPSAFAEPMPGGAIAIHTQMPMRALALDPVDGTEWLTDLGCDLELLHDDARGVFFFPDTVHVEGKTYDLVIEAAEPGGLWVPARTMDKDERKARIAERLRQGDGDGEWSQESAPAAERVATELEPLLAGMSEAVTAGKLDPSALMREVRAAAGRATGAPDGTSRTAFLVKRARFTWFGGAPTEAPTLGDGTYVVVTDAPPRSAASWLAEEWPKAVAKHDDPRGVPSFDASHVALAREGGSYAAAIEALGAKVTFVKPRTFAARAAEQRARLQAWFDESP